jgi:putative SOS response-associated peptidase YedK
LTSGDESRSTAGFEMHLAARGDATCSAVTMLVPFWAQDIKIGGRMVDGRAETVHENSSFRTAFESWRVLIPVDAFDEWLPTDRHTLRTPSCRYLTAAKG